MPPDGNARSAHPQAADWVLGALDRAEAEEFQRHLTGCPHCQAAVAEFGGLGQTLRHLPPPVEPSPDLEARIITSVLAAAAAQRAAVTPGRGAPASADPSATVTDATVITPHVGATVTDVTVITSHVGATVLTPHAGDSGPDAVDAVTDRPSGRGEATVIRFPRRPGRRGLLVIAGAVAAAAIAAAVILPGRGTPAGTLRFALASPRGQAASGTVTARPDNASGSWDITLTVRHLPNPGDNHWYECWWMDSKHRRASAGTFVVGDNGSGTFPMTIAVDPREFPVIKVIEESASSDGTPHGTVVLASAAKRLFSG